MLISFYKRNSVQAAAFLPVLAIVLWIFAFVNPLPVEGRHLMPLYECVVFVIGQYPYITYFFSIALILTGGYLLNSFAVKHEISDANSYLPALLYIVLMSAFPSQLSMHPVIFSNVFLILALNKVMNTFRKDKAYFEVFDAGTFIALATLFYFPAFIFFPIIWVGLILIRPFVWREWVISSIGFLIPFIFVWSYYFWYDSLDYLLYEKVFYPLSARFIDLYMPWSFYFLIGILLLICILGIGKLFTRLTTGSVQSRNNLWLLIWTFALSIISFLIAPSLSVHYFSFAVIPVSVHAANYFLSERKTWLGEVVFYLLLTAIIFNQFINFSAL